jgi:hypothetical protein
LANGETTSTNMATNETTSTTQRQRATRSSACACEAKEEYETDPNKKAVQHAPWLHLLPPLHSSLAKHIASLLEEIERWAYA